MDEWAIVLNDRIIKRFHIDEGQSFTLGRDNKVADIVINNTAISRQHCSLELKGGTYYLTDLYSLNGTKVNGKSVVSAVPIEKNDFIEISKFTLQPMENILADQTAESYAIPSDDSVEQTIFVPAKSKHETGADGFRLEARSGKAFPPVLDLAGKNSIKVGRDKDSDMIISGFLLGRTQFFITRKTNHFALIPVGSIRKIYINGQPVDKETKLNPGDEIKTGGTILNFG